MKTNNLQIYGWTEITLWIIKIGLWLIPFLPLYISSSMLFPFITGKNFAFRIIVEIIFALWVGLAIARAEYRLKLTPLFKAATVFITAVFLADLLGANPYRSLFSNYERMEGFMMLGHLYLYLIIMLSVFKSRTDWLIFFHSTLIASLAVSFIGLLQRMGYRVSLQGGFRVDSTIGNPTYLAAYLLFHIWMLAVLLKEFWKKWWLAALYSAALFFEFLILYFTATRGAVLALLMVSVLFFVTLVLFWNRVFPEKAGNSAGVHSWWPLKRKIAGAMILFLLFVPIFFWQIRSTEFVQKTNVLKRLVNYSLQEKTIQSRFKIWGMSVQAFMDRPLLGWGQENYYLVFQKYFDPGLYAQEPWFDRSHNIFFDWLIHAGLVGLAGFFFMLAAVFYYIKKAASNINFPLWQGLVIAAMFLTHLLQNIFVFDNLNTYLLFFAFLAYAEWLTYPYVYTVVAETSKENSGGSRKPSQDSSRVVNSGDLARQRGNNFNSSSLHEIGLVVTVMLLVAIFALGYFLHIKPVKESRALISTLQLMQTRGVKMDQIVRAFQRTLSYKSFGDTEVREQMANFARGLPGNSSYSPEEQKRFIEFAVDELRKETVSPAKDIKHLLFLAAILSRAKQFNPQYVREAEQLLTDAIRLSPTKQIIQFELAQLYLSQGKVDEAILILKRVVDLEPGFMQAKVNLLIVASLADRKEIVEEVIQSGINIMVLDEESLKRVSGIYLKYGLYDKARPIYLYLAHELATGKAEYRATFSAILAELGEYDLAIEEAKKAAELDNSFSKESETFIEIMKQKKGNR